MNKDDALQTLEYLDPMSPNLEKKLFVPAVGEIKGKRIAFVNNGWLSFTKIGARMEEVLRARYGIAAMPTYPILTSGPPAPGLLERVFDECDAAIVGLAN